MKFIKIDTGYTKVLINVAHIVTITYNSDTENVELTLSNTTGEEFYKVVGSRHSAESFVERVANFVNNGYSTILDLTY